MTRKMLTIVLASVVLAATAAYGAMGYKFRCQAKPADAKDACGYQASVRFGRGEFFDQITGYCRRCKGFVYLRWTVPGGPPNRPQVAQPAPTPLGEVWDSATGQVASVYACPTCSGPFLPIRGANDLKHCPACNQPHFGIDPTEPPIAID